MTLSTQQGGSRVIFGNLLTLPVNDGLLYVEPFYIQGQASSTSFPQLNRVLVWYGGRVGVGTTLTQALTQAAQNAPVPVTDSGTGTPLPTSGATVSQVPTSPTSSAAPPPADQAAALAAMDTAAKALDTAKASGDLGAIGNASQDLETAVNDYLKLAGGSLSASATAAGTAPASDQPTAGG